MKPRRPGSHRRRERAVLGSLLALITAAAQAQPRSAATPTGVETTSIYGERRAPRAPPTVGSSEGSGPSLRAQGLPADGLTRRTDAAPICRGSCAAQWYACGSATAECTAARAVCLAACVTSSPKFGFFGAAPA